MLRKKLNPIIVKHLAFYGSNEIEREPRNFLQVSQ